jgi:S1-C subfamily serine protease
MEGTRVETRGKGGVAGRGWLAALLAGLALVPAGTAAGAEGWEFVAGGGGIKAFLDPASVFRDGEYVRARVRVEYAADRDSPDKKFRFRSAVNGQAMRCEARRGVNVSTTLYDASGKEMAGSSRKREDWDRLAKDIPRGSVQDKILEKACALAGVAPSGEADRPGAAGRVSVGSGVVVAGDGMVLTNQHVVDGCAGIAVVDSEKNRAPAKLVAADAKNDLALLRALKPFPKAATLRQGVQIQAGEAVTVVGYPLVDILGAEPNVTFGYVSATAGPKGDSSSFQISAPIHKGNSGGPILDQNGNVIGVVASKLNALAVARSSGDLPQNISFGIKGEVAQLFLATQNVRFQGGAASAGMSKVEAAALGRAITVMVVCRRK